MREKYLSFIFNNNTYIFSTVITVSIMEQYSALRKQEHNPHDILLQLLETLRIDEINQNIPDDKVLEIAINILKSRNLDTEAIENDEELLLFIDTKIQEVFNQLATSMTQFIESYQESIKSMTSHIYENIQIMGKTISENINNMLSELKLNFDNMNFCMFYKYLSEYIQIAPKYEWIPFEDFSLNDLKYINNIAADDSKSLEEKKKIINSIYFEYLDDKIITSIFNKIKNNQLIRKRKEIFMEVEFAWEKRKYYLGVATIMLVIEGLLLDDFDNVKNYSPKKASYKLQKKEKNKLQEVCYQIVKLQLLANFSSDSSISRNKILHSFDTSFGNKETFLKLLLLLQSLLEWI